MLIERLEVRNFRVFRKAVLSDLPRMVVVVGANGSGKSTLFDVFSFLKDAVAQDVQAAVDKRGGFGELISRDQAGPIRIKIECRETSGRLLIYELVIVTDSGNVIVGNETLLFHEDGHTRPKNLLDFERGAGTAVIEESAEDGKQAIGEEDVYVFDDPSVLAITALGHLRKHRTASELRNLIENWHISNFHIDDARPSAEAGYAEHLSTRGDNVAQVAQYLYEHHSQRFQRMLDAMRRRVPGIESVEARSTEDGRLVLRFQDGSFKDPFIARYVSDGTIKMFAYLVLLYDPRPHPLLAVEEPENQLYPELLRELAEEFRDYARRGGQAFVSTHSPDFLNGVEIDEVFYLVKQDGYTSVRRAYESRLLRDLVKEGDLPGSLWKQGFFEGASSR